MTLSEGKTGEVDLAALITEGYTGLVQGRYNSLLWKEQGYGQGYGIFVKKKIRLEMEGSKFDRMQKYLTCS